MLRKKWSSVKGGPGRHLSLNRRARETLLRRHLSKDLKMGEDIQGRATGQRPSGRSIPSEFEKATAAGAE